MSLWILTMSSLWSAIRAERKAACLAVFAGSLCATYAARAPTVPPIPRTACARERSSSDFSASRKGIGLSGSYDSRYLSNAFWKILSNLDVYLRFACTMRSCSSRSSISFLRASAWCMDSSMNVWIFPVWTCWKFLLNAIISCRRVS